MGKTGRKHLQSLRDGREVYIHGEKVADVTMHPAFRNSVATAASLYDFQAAPENREALTFGSGGRPQRADRRPGRRGGKPRHGAHGLQGERGRQRAHGSRAGGGAPGEGAARAARRGTHPRFRGASRPPRASVLLRGDRDGSDRAIAQRHRRGKQPAGDRCGVGIGTDVGERADRCDRDRGTLLVEPGDRPAGRPVRDDRRQSGRRGAAHRRDGAEARRRGAEDRRGGRPHPKHRRTDEPAGAQRDDRGGARRRSGQGLRGRRVGGEEPRQPDKATEEIAAQIAGIQGVTNEAVGAIRGIAGTIEEISQIATAIAGAVEEQGSATHEIARNVQEAARGTQEVSGNIIGVTEASGAVGQAAGQVLGAAGDLAAQSDRLRQEVDGFLAAVKAA